MALMQTDRISILALSDARHAQDLSNALIGVSGIEHIDVDAALHTLVVGYDPDHLTPDALKTFIKRAGYPIENGARTE
jgi:hypothetical protein